MQLLQWVVCEGCWIVEDDYDGEYCFGGKFVVLLQGLDIDVWVIYVGIFSKVMFLVLWLGYLVLFKDLVFVFCVVCDVLDICLVMLLQWVMIDFICEGYFVCYICCMWVFYVIWCVVLLDVIEYYLFGCLQVIGVEVGMQFIVLLFDDIDDVVLLCWVVDVGVLI